MALLHYSLVKSRSFDQGIQKWEKDVIANFEDTLNLGIVDGYILIGWYHKKFYFLDREWFINRIRENHKIGDKQWFAFMGGLAFSNPPSNKSLYKLFYPHYKKAINIGLEKIRGGSIISHIVSFYFLGYEDLEGEGLLISLIEGAESSLVLNVIDLIWREKVLIKRTLSEDKTNGEAIYNLWRFLVNRYEDAEEKEFQRIAEALAKFLVFVPQLDEKYTKLILVPNKISTYSSDFVKNLTRLKEKGIPIETANYIGQILKLVFAPKYISSNDGENIIKLITFLYNNGCGNMANDICNNLAKLGHKFLIPLYDENNKA